MTDSSPFPGMDPYLEEPTLWSGVHSRLIVLIADDLTTQVRPHFVVGIETRIYLVRDDDERRPPFIPDISLLHGRPPGAERGQTAVITPPTLVEPGAVTEVRERFIEIRDAASRELVTTIEVLSPDNKLAGSRHRDAFLAKRATLMATPVSWVEIDLLRAGSRPPEVANQSDYYMLLWRGSAAAALEVWHVDLRERLPTIAVPLHPPSADVALDLQAVLTRLYERGGYADSLRYELPPPAPRLRRDDATWVAAEIQRWQAHQAANP